MNKTVTINISGIIFHIEEDAYEKLSKYLSTIKGLFSKADGGNEIMSDIEARIAEMLQGKTSAVKQVVLMADVDYVMDSMGKPEDFAGESMDTDNDTEQNYNTTGQVKKRLFRDGDSKVVGGVCSGIGHYFGFDPVWLRIALLLLFFFAGSGFLLYLILWIAIPEAKTTAEKLAMKGEKADINNISKAVKEEAEHLKKRMEKYGKDFQNMSSDRSAPRNAAEKTVDFIADILNNIGRTMIKVIGVGLVVIGVLFFLGLSGLVSGLSFLPDSSNGSDWIDMILLDGKDFYLGMIGIAIFFGTPIIMMIYAGVKILFKIKYTNRWVNLGAGIIWLVGFIMILYVGIKIGSDFNKTAKVRENITVIPHETLYLKMHETAVNYDELNMSDKDEEGEKNFRINNRGNNYIVGNYKGKRYLLGHAQLNIIKSQTDKFELVIVKEAKGSDRHRASERAKNISYVVSQNDSLLEFDNLFKVMDADKFRAQDISIILKLPVGKMVYLDKSLENVMYDIENVTNTYDGDMINRRWIMTEEGLKCVDCEGLISVKDHNSGIVKDDDDSDENVKINVNGVNINAKDASIKVDSTGVNINSKDSKVLIDKNGVHFKTKNK
jgi:phage shock protein PspC (stress-responsive transcriptional regulator)